MRLLVWFACKKRVFRVWNVRDVACRPLEGHIVEQHRGSLHGTRLGLPGVSNTWATAGGRPIKRSGAVYMISYPRPSDSKRPGDRHPGELVIVDP